MSPLLIVAVAVLLALWLVLGLAKAAGQGDERLEREERHGPYLTTHRKDAR